MQYPVTSPMALLLLLLLRLKSSLCWKIIQIFSLPLTLRTKPHIILLLSKNSKHRCSNNLNKNAKSWRPSKGVIEYPIKLLSRVLRVQFFKKIIKEVILRLFKALRADWLSEQNVDDQTTKPFLQEDSPLPDNKLQKPQLKKERFTCPGSMII